MSLYFVFDVETTGLPNKRDAPYSDLEAYDSCRIVSIAWQVLNPHLEVIHTFYSVIRPEGFLIPEASTRIHKISHDDAIQYGIPFESMVSILELHLKECGTLICHNVAFDVPTLMSELFRRNHARAMELVGSKHTFCTMQRGPRKPNGAWMSLERMYDSVVGNMENGNKNKNKKSFHHALVDVECCRDIYQALTDNE